MCIKSILIKILSFNFYWSFKNLLKNNNEYFFYKLVIYMKKIVPFHIDSLLNEEFNWHDSFTFFSSKSVKKLFFFWPRKTSLRFKRKIQECSIRDFDRKKYSNENPLLSEIPLWRPEDYEFIKRISKCNCAYTKITISFYLVYWCAW